MSAFERRRLENNETNKKLLDSASVVARKIAPKTPTPKKSTPARIRTRSTVVKKEAARPTRQSSRLAGIDADNDVLKRKLEVDAESAAAEAKAKKLRVSGDLSLGDIAVEGKKWEAGVGGLKGIMRGAQPGVRTFTKEDVKETNNKELKDLRERMSGLDLYEHWTPHGNVFFRVLPTVISNALARDQDYSATSICSGSSPNRNEARRLCR